ncbi:MAG: type II toxin-antitoxin system prevent-host-death family antitoxin [Anaerolineales bacterium]|nr:type II toxin-antitoxin system prevent-host-death family antitoxin [Anaerolineales bacterium]
MISVGIRELKQQTSELIRLVREEGKELQVTYHGNVVALVVPVTRNASQDVEAAWSSLDVLAAEIGARWPADVTSAEAVAEGRS